RLVASLRPEDTPLVRTFFTCPTTGGRRSLLAAGGRSSDDEGGARLGGRVKRAAHAGVGGDGGVRLLLAVTVPIEGSCAAAHSVVSWAAGIVRIGLRIEVTAVVVVVHPSAGGRGRATDLAGAAGSRAEPVAVVVCVEGRAIVAEALVVVVARA